MRNRNKSGNGLITLLTTLLIVCTLAEAGIASYVGVNIQIAKRANAEIAAQQEEYREYQEQIKADPPVTQYVGPTVRVVDSTVTKGHWEPVQAGSGQQAVNTYTPAPVPEIDVPELDLDTDTKKSESSPTASSDQPKSSGSSGSNTKKPTDTPKPSSGSSNPSSGASKPSGGQSSAATINPNDGGKKSGGASNSSSANQPNGTSKSSNNSNTGSTKSSGGGSWGESSTTNEITGSLDRKAYWVSSGKSYHFSSGCPSLARSKNILEGTLQDALNAGKTDPCNNCAGGS